MDREPQVIILGTGPAGLQAAIHAARAKTAVLVLGRTVKSSVYKAHVENYCCMAGGVTGEELLSAGRKQAEAAGAAFLEEDVVDMARKDDRFEVKTESGRIMTALAVIFALGVARHKLGATGEKEFLGKGVSYCVDCDANFFRNLPVAVAGGESAAVSGALTLLFYASEVHLVAEKLTVSDQLREQLAASSVNLHLGRKVKAILGQKEVDGVSLDDGGEIPVKGVFIELGAKGAIELAAKLGVALDPESFQYIVTDKKQATNVPGLFAAGDITGPPWQMAKAVGEGCVAGLEAAKYAKRPATPAK